MVVGKSPLLTPERFPIPSVIKVRARPKCLMPQLSPKLETRGLTISAREPEYGRASDDEEQQHRDDRGDIDLRRAAVHVELRHPGAFFIDRHVDSASPSVRRHDQTTLSV